MQSLTSEKHKGIRDILTISLDWLLTADFFAIVVLTISQVILRYFFSSSIIGSYEMMRWLFIYSSTLGAAVLLEREGHDRVGLVFNRLPPKIQNVASIFKHTLLTLLHGYLIYLSFDWIRATGGFPSNVLRVPLVFIKISLPIGFGLAAIYSLGSIYDILRGGEI